MSNIILVSGFSGSGKSTSLRNLDWDESFVIKPNGKPFPFRSGHLKPWDSEKKTGHYLQTTNYSIISTVLKRLPEYNRKVIIIEDSTHLLLKFNMDRALEKGYEKFSEAALAFYEMLDVAQSLPEDVMVFLITHLSEDINGNEIIKTVGGKFIEEKMDVASFATIALKAEKTKDGYMFRTQTSGRDFYKSPMG